MSNSTSSTSRSSRNSNAALSAEALHSPRPSDFVIAAGTQFERWRFWCPYGQWTCADGRRVLFNRHYTPIYERRPGALGRVADHSEWVPWVRQEHFFNDGTSPVSWWSIPSWQWQPVVGTGQSD